jgi:hypothetical protein
MKKVERQMKSKMVKKKWKLTAKNQGTKATKAIQINLTKVSPLIINSNQYAISIFKF